MPNSLGNMPGWSDDKDKAEQDIDEEDEIEEINAEQELDGGFRDMVEEENTEELDDEASDKLDEERSGTSEGDDEEREIEYSDCYNTSTGCDSETDGDLNTSIEPLYGQSWVHQTWKHEYRPDFPLDSKQVSDNGHKLNIHEESESGVFDRDTGDSLGRTPKSSISQYENTYDFNHSEYETKDVNVGKLNVYNSLADYEGFFESTDNVNAENEKNRKLKLSPFGKHNLTKDMPRKIIPNNRSEDNISSDIDSSQRSYTESDGNSPGLTNKQEYSPFRVSRNLEVNLNNRLQSNVNTDADKGVNNVFENALKMWDQSDSHGYVTKQAENSGTEYSSCVESSGNSAVQSDAEALHSIHSSSSGSDNYPMKSNFTSNSKTWKTSIFHRRSGNESSRAKKTDESLKNEVQSELEKETKRDRLWRYITEDWNWLRKGHLFLGEENPFWRQPPTEKELLEELEKRELKNRNIMYGKEEKSGGEEEGLTDSDSRKTHQTPQRVSAVQEYINKEWTKYESKYQYLGLFSPFSAPPPDPSFLLTYFSPQRKHDQHIIEEKPIQTKYVSGDSSPREQFRTQNFDRWVPYSDPRQAKTFKKQMSFPNPMYDPLKSRSQSPRHDYNQFSIKSHEGSLQNIKTRKSSVNGCPPNDETSGEKPVMIFKNPHWPKSDHPNGSLKPPKADVPAYGVRQKGMSELDYSRQSQMNSDYLLHQTPPSEYVGFPYQFAPVHPTQPFYYPPYPLPCVYPGFPFPGQLEYRSLLHQNSLVEVDQTAYGQSNTYGRPPELLFEQNHLGLQKTEGKGFNSNTLRRQGTRNNISLLPEQPKLPADQYNAPLYNMPPMPYYWPYMHPPMLLGLSNSRLANWGHQPPDKDPTVEESLRYLEKIRMHNERHSSPNDFIRDQSFHRNRVLPTPDQPPRE